MNVKYECEIKLKQQQVYIKMLNMFPCEIKYVSMCICAYDHGFEVIMGLALPPL